MDKAKDNFIKFVSNELIHERSQVHKYYHNQGYLGRTLTCLVDKLINGVLTSFDHIQDLKESNHAKSMESARIAP